MSENGVRDTLAPGYVLHWYEIVKILGRGGYGVTYLAEDKNLRRSVAIKEYLPTDFACRENNNTVHPMTKDHNELYEWGLERFLSEARTLAKFNHRAIIKVLSVFEQNNTAYMVMEYEEGDDLSVVYDSASRFTQTQILEMFLPILEGLSLVHEAGFIHRDIKPSNIYVRKDGSTVLLDFGSARQTIASQTRALTTLVTAGYAPYEQYNQSEDEQGVWTDIYALGSTLYYFITGNKPADALMRGSSLLRQGRDIYEPVSRLNIEGYTPAFLRAVDHALMFHAEKRPGSVMYWADMLKDKVDVAPITDDLYNLNHQGQADPDLESTVVMKKPPSHIEQSLVRGTTGPAGDPVPPPSAGNSSNPVHHATAAVPQRSGADAVSAEDENDKTRIQIQSISAEQLDRMTESLSRSSAPELPQQQPKPVPQPAVRSKGFLQENLELLSQVLAEIKERIDSRIAMVVAATVVSFVAVAIIIATVFSVDDAKELPSAANNRDILQPAVEAQVTLANVASIPATQSEPTQLEQLPSEEPVYQSNISDGPGPEGSTDLGDNSESIDAPVLSKADRDLKVANLLRLAANDKRQNNIVSPEKDNAYARYEQVLELDPGHPTALQEMSNIRDIYIDKVATNIEKEQWDQAKRELPVLKKLSVGLQTIGIIEAKIQAYQDKTNKIERYLSHAEALFKKKSLTRPKSNNALMYYEKVLALDSQNQMAQQGLNNIIDVLAKVLQRQLKANKIDSASNTYNLIAEINPDSPVLNQAGSRLSSLVEKNNKIRKLLKTAKRDFIRGRIITPQGNNALVKYRAVLKLDRKNKRAKEGIDTIYQYYLADINNGIESGRFEKAGKLINTLASTGYEKTKIAVLRKQLKNEQAATNREPQTINQLLADLALDLKNKNIKGIYSVSVLSDKKKKYLKKLFSNYADYSVNINDTEHDSKRHKATATIELANIVDIWGDRLSAKQKVNLQVQLSRDKNKEWKIYWQNTVSKTKTK